MALDVSTMTSLIRNRVGEESTVRITDAEILKEINDSYKDVSVKAYTTENIDTTIVKSGVHSYSWTGHKITKVLSAEVSKTVVITPNPPVVVLGITNLSSIIGDDGTYVLAMGGVVQTQPTNVTGVTLSSPAGDPGTYALAFTSADSTTWDVPSYTTQNPIYLPPVEYSDYTTLGDWKYNRPVGNITYYAYSHGVTSYFGPGLSYQANGLEIRSADGVNDYLCKDYGVDYFTGDLDFSFSLQDIQDNRVWSAGWPILFSLSNISGGYNAGRMAELYGLLLNNGTYTDVYKIFYLYVNGVAVDSITYTGSWPVPDMYIRFRRVSGITTVTIYEDAAMTTPWTHGDSGKYIMTHGVADNTKYRYCYILVNQIAAGIQAMYWTFWDFINHASRYLSWGGGTPVLVSGSGAYTLSDGSGNSITATVVVGSLPSSDQTDSITILPTLAYDSGTAVTITGDGDYALTGATGVGITATCDLSGMTAAIGTTENITILRTMTNYKGALQILPNVVGRKAIDTYNPQYWFPWGGYVKIEPVPDDEYRISLYIADYPSAALANSTDTPTDLPYEFWPCIVDRVCYTLCIKLRKWGMASLFYNAYIIGLMQRKHEYTLRRVDQKKQHQLPEHVSDENGIINY